MTHRRPLCARQHGDQIDRPALDGHYVCESCRDHVERCLAELPPLHRELESALIPTTPEGPRTSGGGEISLPIALHVAAVRYDIEDYARQLAAWIADQRGHTPPDDITVAACCAWLARHVAWITARDNAAEVVDALDALRARGLHALKPSGRRRFDLPDDRGACPAGDCDGRLTVTLNGPRSALACDLDETHRYPVDQWLDLGRDVHRQAA
ncbi:hypothetical protein SMC26_40390 [Actinomadura fulvescens]|uniref:Uncharacterized protein n=1 Tax=Actinomadura fulvescens TaxID=46160 RepID=A0ABP6CLS0_9ACTN